jgi:hypothetical protein
MIHIMCTWIRGHPRALKGEIPREEVDFEVAIERYNKMNVPFENNMKVIPVPFSSKPKDMLAFVKLALDKSLIAIDESNNAQLIKELRLVTEKDGKVSKEKDNLDIFDSFRLALFGVKMS